MLLFAMTPDAAAQRATSLTGLERTPAEVSRSYFTAIEVMQLSLLGSSYTQASRLRRTALGRLRLPGNALSHADIYRVSHKCGAAVLEVWLCGPVQDFDVATWVGWLDLEDASSPAATLWAMLAGDASAPELYLPLVLVATSGLTRTEFIDRFAHELVALVHRDASGRPMKAGFVSAELASDLSREEDTMWLLSRNGALAVTGNPAQPAQAQILQNSLPLLLTLEVLCLDRAVLRSFLYRFAQGAYGTVDELIELRRDIFDNLEEYYGTLSKTHGYTAESIARGEQLFGIDDLFEAVADRLESLTFEITTRNQQAVSRLGLWLTISFGAIETGFVAASIATWYYRTDLWAVLAWTVGITGATALMIAALLRWKVER